MPKLTRSQMMARVRGKDTRPELKLRRLLCSLGYGYRLHVRELPGTPDLVFKGRRKVMFVHGCFWHRHEGCAKASQPETNIDFWTRKFRRNVERDRESITKLEELGWEVAVIWECELRDQGQLAQRILDLLGPPRRASQ